MAENDDHSYLLMIAVLKSLLLLLDEIYFGRFGYFFKVQVGLNDGLISQHLDKELCLTVALALDEVI
jgi:hypothetical protein